MKDLISGLEKVISEREQQSYDYPEEDLFDDKFRKLIKGTNVLRKAVKVLKRNKMKKQLTIAFDFDNVIHKYRKGWSDGSIYDELNTDVLNKIRVLLDLGHKVFIMSTRSRFQIKKHFDKLNTIYDFELDMNFNTNEIPFRYETFWKFKKFWNKTDVCGICNHKAVFDVLIDDRAITFNPQNPITINEILNFKIINYA